jgi:hypothetical protein
MSGVVLGLFAAALTGCADQEGDAASTPETAKSAITSQGFLANGCAGQGIFAITSNQLIDFVAFDQSAFSGASAQLYSIGQQGQQTLIANTAQQSAVTAQFADMLSQATNFTSAYQQASMLAAQQAALYATQYAATANQATNIATTQNVAANQAAGQTTTWTANQAAGYNNAQSANAANTLGYGVQAANGYNNMNAAQLAAIANQSGMAAQSGQFANANAASVNGASSAAAQGAQASALGASNFAAFGGANNAAIMNSGMSGFAGGGAGFAAAPVGWGWGGFGFAPVIANQLAFSNNAVWNNAYGGAINNVSAAQYGSQFANLYNSDFANVLTNANQAAYANQASNAVTAAQQHASSNYNQLNQNLVAGGVANQAATHNAYSTGNAALQTAGYNTNNIAANQATTVNAIANQGTSLAAQAVQEGSLGASVAYGQQQAGATTLSQASTQAVQQQYAALSNLAQFASNNMVLVVNATAASQQAVINVFTGAAGNTVAANQSFAVPFAGCGVGAAGVVAPIAGGVLLPPAAAVDQANVAPLGDRVATKPE